MKRILLVLVIVATGLVIATAGFLLLRGHTVGTVHLENLSGDPIDTVTVQVSGESYEFESLQPLQKQIKSVSIGKDSSYEISVHFASGKTISGRCGYVTSGVESRVLFKISADEIYIEDMVSTLSQKC
jgi:hypothetical protein